MGKNGHAITNLGIMGIHSVEILVHTSTDWTRYLKDFGFQLVSQNSFADQDLTGIKQQLFRVADVRFLIVESLREDTSVAKYLQRHPEGVRRVNYLVRDIQHTEKTLLERDGTPTDIIRTEAASGGEWSHFAIATALGDVEYAFINTDADLDLPPRFEPAGTFNPDHNPLGISHIDHLTSNVRTLQPLISWYENVMGMTRFWDVQFHTEDLKPGFGSGLKSIVCWDEESGVKLANNEPLRPRFGESQIQIYVDDNRGPGIQHVAFAVKDILHTVDKCNEQGMGFLPTPKTYYDAVPDRIESQGMGKVDESLEEIASRSILIDGKDNGYLLQIFCKEQAVQFDRPNAGPLFIEIIQRKGANGFGEGNFRALFESIEREQETVREWKAKAGAPDAN